MSDGRGPVRWVDRLRLSRPKPDESVAWEIEHHIAELADRLVDEGWEVGEARREAERRFGDRARYGPSMKRMEKGRVAMEMRTQGWDIIREALESVVRTARRYPGFTAGVIVTLGLGIGANATMYGVIDRLLLQPPEHVTDHQAVRLVFGERPSFVTGDLSVGSTITYPDYTDLREHSGLEIAAYTEGQPLTVGSGEGATQARAVLATADFFSLLGVEPRLGRTFNSAEAVPGASPTVVLAEEYWRRVYDADPEVLGRTLQIQGRTTTVVGVLPAGFTGTGLAPVDLWLPLEATHVAQNEGDACMSSRGCWWMRSVARLREGVSVEAAEAEATGLHLAGRAEMIEAGRYSDRAGIVLGPLIAAQGPEASDEARVARWLAGVSLIVLLIACANVANLLMARGVRQRRETSVRLALGASRRRVVVQAILEAVTLSAVGAVLALAIARWGGGVVRSALLPGVYFPNEAWNGRLLVFTALASIAAGVVAGVAPALQGRRADLAGSLGEGGRGSSGSRSRARSGLTVVQAAMSVVLLVGAGLFLRSLGELRALDLGLDVDRLLMARLEFVRQDLPDADQVALYDDVARQLDVLPSVASTASTGVPFQWGFSMSVRVPGLDSLPRLPGGGPYYYPVASGYFSTVGLEVVRGRGLGETDHADSEPVAVVSETMARSLWPETDAVGQCLMLDDAESCTTVVGVVEDAARGGYEDAAFMAYYLPAVQLDTPYRGLYVRTRGNAADAVTEVASVLRAASPDIRFATIEPLREMLDPQARAWRLGAMMFTVFGLLALSLAAIGLYSVLAFDVAQRTRELGIRSALGAGKKTLLRSVLIEGGRLTVLGVFLGVMTAWIAAPYADDLLFRVSPRDPWVMAGVAGVLLAVSVAASIVPGLRATSVDPIEALRAE